MTLHPRAGNKGFTLIEVLIALSVLGVTMTAVFTLFSAGLKLRSVSHDRLAFDRDARLVVGALRDDLANLVPSGPAPMVSFDSIVLWRQSKDFNPGDPSGKIPQLVTYQWSGSATQDSLLVRVVTPLEIDITNVELVRQQFMKWARVFLVAGGPPKSLLREDLGLRFGARATLNELSGSWVSYPRIRGFACGITENPEEHDGEGAQSRILVKLSPETHAESAPNLDPMTRLAFLSPELSGIETGFWVPIEAQTPVLRENEKEVQP